MRTFIVAWDSYCRDLPGISLVKAKDFKALLLNLDFLGLEDEESMCGDCGGKLSNEGIIQLFHETNGDGQPYYVIKEIITELDGIKLVDIPELKGG